MSEKFVQHNFDISSANNPGRIDQTFRTARSLSQEQGRPVGVLVYPFRRSNAFLESPRYSVNEVTIEDLKRSILQTGVQVTGVHGEFSLNAQDAEVQAQNAHSIFEAGRHSKVWPEAFGFAEDGMALLFAEEIANFQQQHWGQDAVVPYIGYGLNIIGQMNDSFRQVLDQSGLPVYIETTGYVPNQRDRSKVDLALELAKRGGLKKSGVIFNAERLTVEHMKPFYDNDEFLDATKAACINVKDLTLAFSGYREIRRYYEGIYLPLALGILKNARIVINKPILGSAAEYSEVISKLDRLSKRSASQGNE